jgi:hypothetical protein
MERDKNMRKVNFLLIVLFFAACASAWADEIVVGDITYYEDPATLHIGPGAGQPGATGAGLHPNPIGYSLVDVYQTSDGASLLGNPLLLILGIPNNTTDLFASNPISSVMSYNTYSGTYPGGGVVGASAFATAGTYGLISPVSRGFFGSFTSGEAYTFLHLTMADTNSNNFGNWVTYDQNIGVTAANFGMYVFALTTALDGQGLVDIQFSQALPLGTYVIAYGQTPPRTNGNGNGKTVMIYDTPFTEAGQTVPEPGSLLLLSTGLLGLVGMVRRKFSI